MVEIIPALWGMALKLYLWLLWELGVAFLENFEILIFWTNFKKYCYHKRAPLHPLIFFEPPYQNWYPSSHLKMNSTPSEKHSPHWQVKPPSRKWFLEKNTEKSEAVINVCVSIIKQQWKKMAEIPQECDFLTWSIQKILFFF